MKTKILRIGFWLFLGVAISTGFVACGNKDKNEDSQCDSNSLNCSNNSFGSQGSQIQVVTDNIGLLLKGGSPPASVSGTLWLFSPIHPQGIPLAFTPVTGGQAVSSYGQTLHIISFRSVATTQYGSLGDAVVSGSVILCQEDLIFTGTVFGAGQCTKKTVSFSNRTLQHDANYGTYKGRLL